MSGQNPNSKNRKLGSLSNAGFFNADFTDVIANSGVSLSTTSEDLVALKGSAASNVAFQSALANTNLKLSNIESNLLATNTAVRSYVDAEVAALVDSAPATLDTLNELAESLGDDANFATTVATNLGQKLGSTATVALTGDATASATAFSANAVSLAVTLSNSGVTAGTYGNTTAIATVTVDAKGRITGVSEVAVGGVDTVSFASANDTLSVVLSDGRILDADLSSFTTEIDAVQSALDAQVAAQVAAQATNESRLDDVEADLDTQEAKQASDLANTNAYVATVDTRVGTQEAKQASDLANTNAYVATVEADLDTQEAKQASDLANTNAYIASEAGRVDQAFADIQATNTAVRSYVDTSVANLVDSAPATLDTLNELAEALGDDANFATTLTTNLGQKLGSTATVTLAGDVTGTANFSANAVTVTTGIAASGVTAGSYGSSSLIPVVTVGADGRVTSVTTSQVSGVTGASYSASNNTVTITTADGQSYGATITDLKEISEAAAELANTNTRVAVVESNVAQKLGDSATVELTGDATASATAFSANAVSLAVTLSNSGVTAGNYGDGSNIPVVTVDAKGRVTGVSTVAVAGVSGFDYEGANNTFTITTADGGSFSATIDDLEEVSNALAVLANTNSYIASVATDLDTQEAKQASDLANTNSYIASVATDLDTQEAKQASDLANTNARVAVTESNITTLDGKVDSNLANTNAYIASVATDLDTQEAKQASDLANTNAYIASEAGRVDQAFADIQATNTAVRSYVDAEVAALVDSAPATLDTLNELAEALGDDANFATTLTTNLGQKLGSTATVALTGDATASATAFSANAVSLAVTLASTGTPTGTFGSSSQVAQITVDSKGRVTNVANVAVAGVQSFGYTNANNTLVITTADGDSFEAQIEDFELQSDADSRLANTNAYIASVATDLDTQEAKQASDLANTNAYIASVATDLDTQEAKQATDLANTNAYIASVATDLDTQEAKQASDLANTNAYIATVDTRVGTQEAKQASDLANTNAYIASVATDLDTQEAKQASDLANTNAYIASEAGRVDQAFADIQATNTAVRGYVDSSVAALVDSAPATLDTLNELAAALGDDANFVTTVTTNLGQKLGSTATVTLSGDVTGTASFSANAVTVTTVDTNLANTNAYIASVATDLDTQEAKQASDLANTNAYIATVEADLDTQEAKQASDLANTNAYIATVEADLDTQEAKQASDLANTNTRVATVEGDLATQIASERSALANTNAQIITLDTKVDSNLANTNAKLINVESNLLATNTAIRALIPDQVAFTEYVFTATAGQTVFTGNDDHGASFTYNPDKLSVFLNGIMIVKGVDFTQTNSTTITLDDPTTVNDVITIQSYEVANYVSKEGDVAPVSGSASGADSVIDTFGTGDYRTVKYLVQATDSSNNEYESLEVMVLHNGSTVQLVEYAGLQTSGSLVTVDADIFGGNIRLLATPTSGTVAIKAIRLAVSV